jgi:ADP-ribose pyrophosphatase YjhB (NUDIX family)
MVKHRDQNTEWWCLPGGGIHEEESPSDAALRELAEECNVTGAIVRATSGAYAEFGIVVTMPSPGLCRVRT